MIRKELDSIVVRNEEPLEDFWIKIQNLYNTKLENFNSNPEVKKKLEERFYYFYDSLIKVLPQKRYELNIMLNDHCNLNCKGCFVFAPLSFKKEYPINDLIEDLQKIKPIFTDKLKYISFMGGEPLLYSNLEDVLKKARNIFPDTSLYVITNGILLKNQKDSFFETCKSSNIVIHITKYPTVKIDEDFLKEKDCNFEYTQSFRNHDDTISMYKAPLDINGTQDTYDSYFRCFAANNCITLRNRKLYTCTREATIDIFNKAFNFSLPQKGIDLDKSRKEVLKYLATPSELCRHCCEINEKYDWEKSDKNINEWL